MSGQIYNIFVTKSGLFIKYYVTKSGLNANIQLDFSQFCIIQQTLKPGA